MKFLQLACWTTINKSINLNGCLTKRGPARPSCSNEHSFLFVLYFFVSKSVIVFGNLNKSQIGQLSGLKIGRKLYWGVFQLPCEFQIDQTSPSPPKKGSKELVILNIGHSLYLYCLQRTHANVLSCLFWYTNVFKCSIKV